MGGARGSASLLSSQGRGIGPHDGLKKDSRCLSRGAHYWLEGPKECIQLLKDIVFLIKRHGRYEGTWPIKQEIFNE